MDKTNPKQIVCCGGGNSRWLTEHDRLINPFDKVTGKFDLTSLFYRDDWTVWFPGIVVPHIEQIIEDLISEETHSKYTRMIDRELACAEVMRDKFQPADRKGVLHESPHSRKYGVHPSYVLGFPLHRTGL